MSTDHQLLELAAKAAGLPWEQWVIDGDDSWTPLIDDGDALRLAVKLRLTIDVERDRCCVSIGDHSGRFGVQPWDSQGPEAATRRAIVRAAAQIGRAMP